MENENNDNIIEPIKKDHPCLRWLLAIIIVLGLVVGIICGIGFGISSKNNNQNSGNGGTNNLDNPTLLSRSATNSDIYFKLNNDFSLSINGIITPYEDITNLQLTFIFIDKNGATITTKTKTIGNSTKNIDYTVSFSLSEFTFSQIWNIQKVGVDVTGGSVSYFG